MDQGGERPTHQHGVKRKDSARSRDKKPAHWLPAATCSSDRRQQRTVTGAAAQSHLSHQHREADHQHNQQVQQQKRATAPLGSPVGKAPEISQADGTASGRQHKSQP